MSYQSCPDWPKAIPFSVPADTVGKAKSSAGSSSAGAAAVSADSLPR